MSYLSKKLKEKSIMTMFCAKRQHKHYYEKRIDRHRERKLTDLKDGICFLIFRFYLEKFLNRIKPRSLATNKRFLARTLKSVELDHKEHEQKRKMLIQKKRRDIN
jgi:hypothetical protein